MIRTLIVDDEPLARKRLRDLLAVEPDVEILGECRNGEEALALLQSIDLDVVFLDVQMPDLDGFDVVVRIERRPLPLIVFVTAYDRYAIRAFDVHALDYLLKPFQDRRFHECLGRLRESSSRTELNRRQRALERFRETLGSDPKARRTLLQIRVDDRTEFVDWTTIQWICAAGVYSELVTDAGSFLVRFSMRELEAALPESVFARIHRSTIVNLDGVASMKNLGHGDAEVKMKSDDVTFRVSRRYRSQCLKKLGERSIPIAT